MDVTQHIVLHHLGFSETLHNTRMPILPNIRGHMIWRYVNQKGSAAMQTSTQWAGVAPEMNLWNSLHAGEKARKGSTVALKPRADVTRCTKQGHQWPYQKARLPCWPLYGHQVSHHRWIRWIHKIQVTKHAKEGSTLALKPRRDVTRSAKQGYQWPHKKDLRPPKIKTKNCE